MPHVYATRIKKKKKGIEILFVFFLRRITPVNVNTRPRWIYFDFVSSNPCVRVDIIKILREEKTPSKHEMFGVWYENFENPANAGKRVYT